MREVAGTAIPDNGLPREKRHSSRGADDSGPSVIPHPESLIPRDWRFAGLERRRSPRVAVALRCQCHGAQAQWCGLISEVGAGGLGLVSGHRPEIGERLTIIFDCGSSLTAQLAGSVRYIAENRIGIQFLSAEDGGSTRILQLFGLIDLVERPDPAHLHAGSVTGVSPRSLQSAVWGNIDPGLVQGERERLRESLETSRLLREQLSGLHTEQREALSRLITTLSSLQKAV